MGLFRLKRFALEALATDSIVLYLTQHKNTWLAAISSQSVCYCITSHDICLQKH